MFDRARHIWLSRLENALYAIRPLTHTGAVLAWVLLLVTCPRTSGQVLQTSVNESSDGALVEFQIRWAVPLAAAVDSAGTRDLNRRLLYAVSGGELATSRTIPVSGETRVEIVASEFDEIYLNTSHSPDAALLEQLSGPVAELQSVGWHRRRLVGTVAVRLISYDDNTKVLRRHRRIVIRVPGGGAASAKLVGSGQFTNPHLSVDRSVLADGRVFKMAVRAEAIYKIDRAFLSALGLNPDAIDPARVRVYGNGGGPLPALNSDPRPADLLPRPALVTGGGDGSFAGGDAVYFFARGPTGWRYDASANTWKHYVHPFSNESYVFIKIAAEDGPTVQTTPFPNFESPTVFSQVVGRHFVDTDVFMWSKEHGSGLTWVSNPLQTGGRFDVMSGVQLPGFIGGPVRLTTRVAIRSNPPATVQFLSGPSSIGSVRATQIITPGAEQPTAAATTSVFNYTAPAGPVSLTMSLAQQPGEPQAALDWLRLEYPQELRAVDGLLRFSAPAGASGPHEFQLTALGSSARVWDVTDLSGIRRLETRTTAQGVRFQANLLGGEAPREYIAFELTAARLLEPDMAVEIQPQNLHGITDYPDFVIVAPSGFVSLAEELAQLRRAEGLSVLVVDVAQIYNEFSGGVPDMRAVRDYFKFLYDRAPDEESMLRYALLFGDGHFDYRGLRSGVVQTPNLILPYETDESFHPDRSYTSDDYFGLLDDNEGEWVYLGFAFRSDERLDIGIGRLPVKTQQEARIVLDKIRRYQSPESFGPWRGLYTYIADDAFTGATGNRRENDLHMQNIDSVAELVRLEAEPTLNARKIYAESFERVFFNEFRVPDAKDAILKTIRDGTLVVNYAGHGGPVGLAQEDLFTSADAAALTNGEKTPVFITATCSFGWWDIDDVESGAETLLLNPNGGAVAMLTTVRLVYTSSDTSSLNPGLNRALNRALFQRNPDGQVVRLGDAMVVTKNTNVGLLGNSRKFSLLGDPTMRLGIPARSVSVERVNETDVTTQTGQFPALERITMTGTVRRQDGLTDTSFEGRVDLTVFDAERRVPIKHRAFMPTPYYLVREDLIWRGTARASGGLWTATFVVPKDISYSNDFGRVYAYASGSGAHASGITENVVVGGTASNPPNDTAGPEISLFLNDTTFVGGGLTHPDPTLIVRLYDESGINTVGAGVGHEMLLVVNGDENAAVDVSSAFRSDENSFQRGSVEWQLPKLNPGPGSVSLRAWDVLNNSANVDLEFLVAESTDLRIRNVFNYPNPTSGRTRFVFEHNQPPGTPADVRIRIYTLNGRPIRTMETTEALPSGILGGGPVMVLWDGTDDDRDRIATGIYLYKVRVEVAAADGQRQVAEHIEKLAMIR